MVSQVDSYFWKEMKWKDAYKKTLGSCNRNKKSICSKKEEDVPVVEGGKRRDASVHNKTIEEGLH